MPKRHYSQSIGPRIDALIADEVVMQNSWAANFLPSVKQQFARKGSLTANQFKVLEDLEEKYSEENKKKLAEEERLKKAEEQRELEEWSKEYFGTELQTNGEVVAKYYKKQCEEENQEWFKSVWTAILAGELPTKRGYTRMMGNDYARKVLNEWNKEPVYPQKSLVQPRKKAKESWGSALKGVEFGFVMKVNVDIPSPCKGGKKYLILPKGELKAIVCEERDLKVYKNK